jgi:hypothetical protein
VSRFAPLALLALLLAACGDFTGGTPGGPTPQSIEFRTCTANVPVTEDGDGDTNCVDLTITLPND